MYTILFWSFSECNKVKAVGKAILYADRHRGYKENFMLNSAEHEIVLLINVKMPTNVGILTFASRKNSILGLSEPEKC